MRTPDLVPRTAVAIALWAAPGTVAPSAAAASPRTRAPPRSAELI